MDKLIAILHTFAGIADKLAALANAGKAAGLPIDQKTVDEINADAAAVKTAVAEFEQIAKSLDGNRLLEWLKHGGNLPGTPESRGEVSSTVNEGQ